MQDVQKYYDEIAQDYDGSRFSNTYGNFIHEQEKRFLKKELPQGEVLSLGCGTGRFMELCTAGLDFSSEMLKIAETKHPTKSFFLGDADTTPFDNDRFDAIICFHVIMHLTPTETAAILREANRILKPGGKFIFDYPSAERRKLTGYKADNWHGGNHFYRQEIKELLTDQKWQGNKCKGVLFLPIHRFPKKFRRFFLGVDQLAASSPFKHYSSYLIHSIQKP